MGKFELQNEHAFMVLFLMGIYLICDYAYEYFSHDVFYPFMIGAFLLMLGWVFFEYVGGKQDKNAIGINKKNFDGNRMSRIFHILALSICGLVVWAILYMATFSDYGFGGSFFTTGILGIIIHIVIIAFSLFITYSIVMEGVYNKE